MKILMIGGNGNISWYCTDKALEAGYEVWELNRGMTRSTRRGVQPQVHQILADMNDEALVRQLLEAQEFDVVCDFICPDARRAEEDIRLFQGRVGQFIFISSESVYRRKSAALPFQETAEQYDPMKVEDAYIGGKIRAEQVFQMAYEKTGFPVTIVRPGYTYDVIVPAPVGQNCFTAPQKFLDGYPLLMPGDGTNLWTCLHSRDFAEAFVALLGNPAAIGEDFHITSDQLLTWNELAEQLLLALGLTDQTFIHIPYKEAFHIDTFQSRILVQQRLWHHIYDNSKIKKVAQGWRVKTSFAQGIQETVQWLMEDPVRRRINPLYDAALKKLYQQYWRNEMIRP